MVLTQYAGAFIYILIAAVLQYGYDPNVFSQACSGGAIICIVVYGLIKVCQSCHASKGMDSCFSGTDFPRRWYVS